MKTSFSALETFKQCPQKYKYHEIDRIKSPKSKELIFGSHIHECMQFIHKTEPIFPSLNALLVFYRTHWPHTEKIHWESPEEEKMYKNEGERILSVYHKHLDTSKTTVIDLESSFSVLLDDGTESHIIKGKIDRVDKLEEGKFEIIDYKTSRSLPSQDSVDNNLQLAIYHLALLSKWPKLDPEQVLLSLYFLKHNEKLSTTKTSNQLEETKQEILKTISEIKTSDFSPTPSVLCGYCAYRNICPLWKHEYNRKAEPKKHIDIQNTVNKYLILKTKIQENEKEILLLKEKIDIFCDENGVERVFSNDGSITRKIYKRYAYDLVLLKLLLEPLNTWQEVLTIDNKKLKEVTKALPVKTRKQIEQTREIISEYKVFFVSKK